MPRTLTFRKTLFAHGSSLKGRFMRHGRVYETRGDSLIRHALAQLIQRQRYAILHSRQHRTHHTLKIRNRHRYSLTWLAFQMRYSSP